MIVDLIALKPLKWKGRQLKVGDPFQATTQEAKVIADWYGKARRLTTEEEKRSVVSGAESRRQAYRRRDMRAAPAAEAQGGDYETKTAETPAVEESRSAVEAAPEGGDLESLTRKQLYDLATVEGIEINAADTKPVMIEKITRARAVKR